MNWLILKFSDCDSNVVGFETNLLILYKIFQYISGEKGIAEGDSFSRIVLNMPLWLMRRFLRWGISATKLFAFPNTAQKWKGRGVRKFAERLFRRLFRATKKWGKVSKNRFIFKALRYLWKYALMKQTGLPRKMPPIQRRRFWIRLSSSLCG